MRRSHISMYLFLVFVLGFVIIGCGGKDVVSDMTGTWKSDKGDSTVKINFSGKDKSIEIDGKTVPVTVKNVDKGSYRVTVTADPPDSKPSDWSLRQVWNDNGSSFKIDFEHDGVQETLTRVEK